MAENLHESRIGGMEVNEGSECFAVLVGCTCTLRAPTGISALGSRSRCRADKQAEVQAATQCSLAVLTASHCY